MPLHRLPIVREMVQCYCTLRESFKLMPVGCNFIAPYLTKREMVPEFCTISD